MWFFSVLFDFFTAYPFFAVGVFLCIFLFFEKLWFALRKRPADMSVLQYMLLPQSRKFF